MWNVWFSFYANEKLFYRFWFPHFHHIFFRSFVCVAPKNMNETRKKNASFFPHFSFPFGNVKKFNAIYTDSVNGFRVENPFTLNDIITGMNFRFRTEKKHKHTERKYLCFHYFSTLFRLRCFSLSLSIVLGMRCCEPENPTRKYYHILLYELTTKIFRQENYQIRCICFSVCVQHSINHFW